MYVLKIPVVKANEFIYRDGNIIEKYFFTNLLTFTLYQSVISYRYYYKYFFHFLIALLLFESTSICLFSSVCLRLPACLHVSFL